MKTLGLHRIVASFGLAFALLVGAPTVSAQEDEVLAQAVESADASAEVTPEEASPGADAYTPMTPTEGKGMPVQGGIDIQPQHSAIGHQAYGLHFGLFWVMVAISLFVLVLMLYVVFRFRRKANPVPSKTSHNTLIEIVWTVLPALILLVIAVPSIRLLAAQYETAPKDAITVKAIGVQWHWEYEYPDHGVSLVSKMLNEPGMPEVNAGVREVGSQPWDGPAQLEVDNRLVVPVGVPLRIQVTANDVIHSFAVPSLWFKIDAVPGRLNERLLTIDEPGVYYGQCSELCGAKHGYMPIALEAVPMDQWRAWVASQGGTFPGDRAAEEDEQSAEDAAEAGDAEGEAAAAAAEDAA